MVPRTTCSHRFCKCSCTLIRGEDEGVSKTHALDVNANIPGKRDIRCGDVKIGKDFFVMDIDRNTPVNPPAEHPRDRTCTHGFSGFEPLVLSCVAHIGNYELVC